MSEQTINFSVDAKLLQELGERLVGKPHIALGELVKNSYDADATFTKIIFSPEKEFGPKLTGKGEIVVKDDGHGMTFNDFRDFWMRIGTTHKSEKEFSPNYKRRMTGSKGVGRLSVQFLAHRLELMTVPKQQGDTPSWIWAYVDWDDAVESGDLTSATVIYEVRTDEPPFKQGTELRLEGLKQTWSNKELKDLAREVWWLQPPFRKKIQSLPLAEQFEIRFQGNEEAFQEFQKQLDAILRIQMARVIGVYHNGKAKIAIEFWKDGLKAETFTHEYQLGDISLDKYKGKDFNPDKHLHETNFEFRIYKAIGRQSGGIRVGELREYLERFAGVHVYDGPFRLPYYGEPESDWLRVEYDHAHRQFMSKLLPQALQDAFRDTERLRYLPTLRRIVGVVQTNTSKEKSLKISITRDRFSESQAQEDLRWIVRYALDLYAYHAARKAFLKNARFGKTKKPSEVFRGVEDVLVAHKTEIPTPVYRSLETSLKKATRSMEKVIKTEKDQTLTKLSLLAPLATAGIAAVAIQHELRKQLGYLDELVISLEGLRTGNQDVDVRIEHLSGDLRQWAGRTRQTNMLFDYMQGDNVSETQRYQAKVVVENVCEQMAFMSRGISIETSLLKDSLYLPEASFAEWGAIFQNIFSNSFNAMLESQTRILSVSSSSDKKHHTVLIQDTGKGVDLQKAEGLFVPFKRGIKNDPVHVKMGYGGTGLGLTIVRLLSDKIGCSARFIKPEDGFSSALALEWEEQIAQRKKE